MKIGITAIIIVRNEADNLEKCLSSLSFCHEIIVIDDYSTDGTTEVAEKLGATVYQRHLNGDFASQRNYALKLARNKWVLFVDADEIVSPQLAREIIESISATKNHGFLLKREDRFLGKKLRHGENFQNSFLRLAKKDEGHWVRPVHETWKVSPPLGSLKNPLFHYPHPGISDFLEEINQYTEIEAAYRTARGLRLFPGETIIFPALKFIRNYFFRLGFLDGFPGLVMAYLMSLHSLVLRVKVRQKSL